ncbi:MAG: long-chain-fatty-acid--CoA ligase [Pseudomonadales bacterium]
MLIQQVLTYYAQSNPNLPCLTVNGETKTYSDMDRLSNQFANGLLSLGISKGDRVTVFGENSLEHVLLFYATAKLGAIVVPINYRLAPAELEYVVGDCGAKLLLALSGMDETLKAVRKLLPEDILLMSDGLADTLNWKTWITDFPDTPPAVEVQPSDPFLQLYTSGTTGHPKGVVSSHFNLMSLCQMNGIVGSHRNNPGDSAIVCAPLFHIGGIGSISGATFFGQHMLLHEAFDPIRILNDVEAHAVGSVFMVPAMIAAVLQVPGVRDRDFSKLKQINYGASPISETSLREAIEVFQCDFTQMYGMTETTGTVVALTTLDHQRALDGKPELLLSCGRPCVCAEAKIADADGNPVATGEIGEIWLKAPTNMMGYHNLPEATAASLTDGWVHTGDAGYIDDEGYIYLKDRIKDMVVSGAENIYPVEVENAIAKHASVREVAVIGVPNEKFGEALLAFVVLKPNTELSIEELIEFCRDKIAGYKIPRQMELIDELPRNPSGKILKKILRAPFWEGRTREIG